MQDKALNQLFIKNRKKLREKIEPGAIVLMFSNDQMRRNGDQFFRYRQNSNMFYMTGIDQPNTILLLSGENEKDDILFLEETTETSRVWEGEKLTPEEGSELSGIENVENVQSFEKILASQLKTVKTVYFDLPEELSHKATFSQTMRYFKSFRQKFPFHSVKSLRSYLTELRMIKEPEEIEMIRRATKITEKAFRRAAAAIAPGTNEKEIEALLSYEFTINHINGHAFDPVVASGSNACVLHYVKNNMEMKAGTMLLMDFGAEYKNYAADISRTLPVSGTFSSRQKEVYLAVLEVMEKAIRSILPGKTVAEINRQVSEWLIEKHIELGIYKRSELEARGKALWKKYFPHGVSHFMGLDVHDCGSKVRELEPGMVLSCEPGIYIAEEGIGVRIEDDILVGKNAPENLSSGFPKSTEEIEDLMH
jgi:Xaa-Pro aminopeptidase